MGSVTFESAFHWFFNVQCQKLHKLHVFPIKVWSSVYGIGIHVYAIYIYILKYKSL